MRADGLEPSQVHSIALRVWQQDSSDRCTSLIPESESLHTPCVSTRSCRPVPLLANKKKKNGNSIFSLFARLRNICSIVTAVVEGSPSTQRKHALISGLVQLY
jgi:hypothetical protein